MPSVYGYCFIFESEGMENLTLQIRSIRDVFPEAIIVQDIDRKSRKQQELLKLMTMVKPGDKIVVVEFLRLADKLTKLLKYGSDLEKRKTLLISLTETFGLQNLFENQDDNFSGSPETTETETTVLEKKRKRNYRIFDSIYKFEQKLQQARATKSLVSKMERGTRDTRDTMSTPPKEGYNIKNKFVVEEVVKAYHSKKPLNEIISIFKISRRTIFRYLKKYNDQLNNVNNDQLNNVNNDQLNN